MKIIKKTWDGIVVSDKADSTVTVLVSRKVLHPIYRKRYTVSQKFMVHNPNNQAKLGDRISFAESRPLSARKRHILVEVLGKRGTKRISSAGEAQ